MVTLPITVRDKALLVQQADVAGWFDTARTLRLYLQPGAYDNRDDVVRVHVLARAFGWGRLPGWRLLCPSLYVSAR